LFEALGAGGPDPELMAQVARALSSLRARVSALPPIDAAGQERLTVLLQREARAAYQVLATIADLDLPAGELLLEALHDLHKHHRALIFRLLGIRHPVDTIELIFANLDSENKAIRANAVEVLDNVLTKDELRLLVPLLEDNRLSDKLARGSELFPLARKGRAAWIAELLGHASPWIASCALHYAGCSSDAVPLELVVQQLASSDAVVRETACLTLARLLPRSATSEARAGELLVLARSASEAQEVPVRRAGATLLSALRHASEPTTAAAAPPAAV
jgi:hypothetical protein